ncbi:CRISPR-associated endonuclease Cas2 [Helicobacter muridarum]|nr:CRISPR-associated endonuclease Cas2 [Helicobacter muridarum]
MFDVPTRTKEDRKNSARFRQQLIKDGFMMLQFSVYMRICRGATSANNHIDRVSLFLPPRGHVRALILTEKQFDNMRLLLGKISNNEQANKPKELTLF